MIEPISNFIEEHFLTTVAALAIQFVVHIAIKVYIKGAKSRLANRAGFRVELYNKGRVLVLIKVTIIASAPVIFAVVAIVAGNGIYDDILRNYVLKAVIIAIVHCCFLIPNFFSRHMEKKKLKYYESSI